MRLLFIVCGWLCVALAALGVLLPVLPTTPFLLLAAYLFARSSTRFYRWLLTNKLFGSYLRNYLDNKGIPLKVKLAALSLLWVTITYAAIVVITMLWAKILIIVIASLVSIHILRQKTFRKKPH